MAAAPPIEIVDAPNPQESARLKLAEIVADTELVSMGVRTHEIKAGPGRIVGLLGSAGMGLSRWGLSLLVESSQTAPVVAVDTQGWLNPSAAWEAGIDPSRLYIVRCLERQQWAQVVAALISGVPAVYAEVPQGTSDQVLRRLAALARKEQSSVVFRSLHGELPPGVAFLSVRAHDVGWEGMDQGHGHLVGRTFQIAASGKSMPEQRWEVEDGKGAVHLVGRVAASSSRRSVS